LAIFTGVLAASRRAAFWPALLAAYVVVHWLRGHYLVGVPWTLEGILAIAILVLFWIGALAAGCWGAWVGWGAAGAGAGGARGGGVRGGRWAGSGGCGGRWRSRPCRAACTRWSWRRRSPCCWARRWERTWGRGCWIGCSSAGGCSGMRGAGSPAACALAPAGAG